MAHVENKMDGRKGRRSENKTETGKSSAGKADGDLNFTLTAGALGLGIALLEREQVAAANAASAPNLSQDDDRLSDSSLAVEQAKPGIGQSAITGHVVHDSGDGAPSTASEAQTDRQRASSADSEGTLANLRQVPEAAESQAAGAAAPTDTGLAVTTSQSNLGEGEAIEEAPAISSLANLGMLDVDLMPGDAPGAVESTLQAAGDIANDLLGSDSVLGVVPAVAEALDSLVGEDGALEDLTGSVEGALGGLTGVGSLFGGNDSAEEAASSAEIVSTEEPAETVALDSLVGEDGALEDLTGSVEGALGGLTGVGNLFGGNDSAEEAASSAEIVSAEEPVETTAQTEPTPADASSETPSNVFDAANAALQITEYVADALTPTLQFVGQPIIETDAHADTDNSSITLAQHAA